MRAVAAVLAAVLPAAFGTDCTHTAQNTCDEASGCYWDSANSECHPCFQWQSGMGWRPYDFGSNREVNAWKGSDVGVSTFWEAQNYCRTQGGMLLKVNDAAMQKWLGDVLWEAHDAWVGLWRDNKKWCWVDASCTQGSCTCDEVGTCNSGCSNAASWTWSGYESWTTTIAEPNQMGGGSTASGVCGRLMGTDNSNWADYSCIAAVEYFICERSITAAPGWQNLGDGYEHRVYEGAGDYLTFNCAQDVCSGLGGGMSTITSAAYENPVTALFQEKLAHLGLSAVCQEAGVYSSWAWLSGRAGFPPDEGQSNPPFYQHWSPGLPDGGSRHGRLHASCASGANFHVATGASCAGSTIVDIQDCESAAGALGFSDTTAQQQNGDGYPMGCSFFGGQLYMNYGRDCTNTYRCLCQGSSYATTTGNCGSHLVLTLADCQAVANAVWSARGWGTPGTVSATTNNNRPRGCYVHNTGSYPVYFNTGSGANACSSGGLKCACYSTCGSLTWDWGRTSNEAYPFSCERRIAAPTSVAGDCSAALSLTPAKIVLWYLFDEGTGSTAASAEGANSGAPAFLNEGWTWVPGVRGNSLRQSVVTTGQPRFEAQFPSAGGRYNTYPDRDFSVCFWLRVPTVSCNGESMIFGVDYETWRHGYGITYTCGSEISFIITGPGATSQQKITHSASDAASWTHFCFMHASSATLSSYRNGVAEGTTNGGVPTHATITNRRPAFGRVFLGAFGIAPLGNAKNGRPFDIDELLLVSAVLSAAQVTTVADGCGQPTPAPTKAPSVPPSRGPTSGPTASPTKGPTASPTAAPTKNPSKSPSRSPTTPPTRSPASLPTSSPTLPPTASPTGSPTEGPTVSPTAAPTRSPSTGPTRSPSVAPSRSPVLALAPTMPPTRPPSRAPSVPPSVAPSAPPSTPPSKSPSAVPSTTPTRSPTVPPSPRPTATPSLQPSRAPTASPVLNMTGAPSKPPVIPPTAAPTTEPTATKTPTWEVTATSTQTRAVTRTATATSPVTATEKITATPTIPTSPPTAAPSTAPSVSPSASPTDTPTASPTLPPTVPPTYSPSRSPTGSPTRSPSASPSASPTVSPTVPPTVPPSAQPSSSPTNSPSISPSSSPSTRPTSSPTLSPSSSPTASPTTPPTDSPTLSPTTPPSRTPTGLPTVSPTKAPTTRPPTLSPSVPPTRGPTASPASRAPSLTPTIAPSAPPTVPPSVPPSQSPSGATARPSSPPTVAPTVPPASSTPSVAPSLSPSLAPRCPIRNISLPSGASLSCNADVQSGAACRVDGADGVICGPARCVDGEWFIPYCPTASPTQAPATPTTPPSASPTTQFNPPPSPPPRPPPNPPPPPPPPAKLSSETRKATQSAAAAASSAAAVGTAAAASQAGKLSLLLHMLECPVEVEEADTMGWTENPMQWNFAGYRHGGQVGAMIGNLVLTIIIILAHLSVAVVFYVIRRTRTGRGTFFAAMGLARFPSYSFIPCMFFYQTTLESCLKVLFYEPGGIKAAAVGIMLVYHIGLGAALFHITSPRVFKANFVLDPFDGSVTARVKRFVLGYGDYWSGKDRSFVWRYGLPFQDFWHKHRRFMLVEIVSVFALAIIDAIDAPSSSFCKVQLWLIFLVLLAYSIALAKMRPYHSPLNNIAATGTTVLQAATGLCILIHLYASGNDDAIEVAKVCLFGSTIFLLVKGALDILGVVYDNVEASREGRCGMQRGERNANAAKGAAAPLESPELVSEDSPLAVSSHVLEPFDPAAYSSYPIEPRSPSQRGKRLTRGRGLSLPSGRARTEPSSVSGSPLSAFPSAGIDFGDASLLEEESPRKPPRTRRVRGSMRQDRTSAFDDEIDSPATWGVRSVPLRSIRGSRGRGQRGRRPRSQTGSSPLGGAATAGLAMPEKPDAKPEEDVLN